tara:strand:- start:3468 stop:3671 length:204 start_codon:yes stop_codon:yes gene_type:complete
MSDEPKIEMVQEKTLKKYKYSSEYIKEKNKRYYEKHREKILNKHKSKNESNYKPRAKKYVSVEIIKA